MPDNNRRDYYADLGLEHGASVAEIKTAFHNLARQHHPDKTGVPDSTDFRIAREAFEKLTDDDFRADYDRTRRPRQPAAASSSTAAAAEEEERVYGPSRTEQYAAAEEARRRSPPPYKPKRKSTEPSWAYYYGKAYLAWAKRHQAWLERHPEQVWYEEQEQQPPRPSSSRAAHGLPVQMSDHPASREDCLNTTQDWRIQPGGQDVCIFCMTMHTGGNRCPGCQALACPSCLREITVKERDVRPHWSSRTGYSFRTSGGG